MKHGLQALSRLDRRVAKSEIGKRVRTVQERHAAQQLVNTGLGFAASVGAAVVDHKLAKGGDDVARLGSEDSRFRPPVNAVVALAAVGLAVLASGKASTRKYAGSALAVALGTGGPVAYNLTRDKLSES